MTDDDHSPWRERNLQQVEEARRVLRQARSNNDGQEETMTEPTSPEPDDPGD